MVISSTDAIATLISKTVRRPPALWINGIKRDITDSYTHTTLKRTDIMTGFFKGDYIQNRGHVKPLVNGIKTHCKKNRTEPSAPYKIHHRYIYLNSISTMNDFNDMDKQQQNLSKMQVDNQ